MQNWDAAMEDLTRLKETIDNNVSTILVVLVTWEVRVISFQILLWITWNLVKSHLPCFSRDSCAFLEWWWESKRILKKKRWRNMGAFFLNDLLCFYHFGKKKKGVRAFKLFPVNQTCLKDVNESIWEHSISMRKCYLNFRELYCSFNARK